MNGIFKDNTPTDDVAMLANLLCQIRDLGGEFPEATAYDQSTNTDFGLADVLRYIRVKYGENFC